MIFSRSRPWRPRGPAFGTRAGARRRGSRHHELPIPGSVNGPDDALAFDFGIQGDAAQPLQAPDEPGAWPAHRVSATYIHAARIDESGLQALARRSQEQAAGTPGEDERSLIVGAVGPGPDFPAPLGQGPGILAVAPRSRRSA